MGSGIQQNEASAVLQSHQAKQNDRQSYREADVVGGGQIGTQDREMANGGRVGTCMCMGRRSRRLGLPAA